MDGSFNKNDIWYLIKDYFNDSYLHELVKHQIDSYNDFIEKQMFKTIDMFNPIHIKSPHDYIPEFKKYRLEIEIMMENLCIYRPEIHENNGSTKLMFPSDARLRNFTYSSNITLDLKIKYIIRSGKELENVNYKYINLSKIHFVNQQIHAVSKHQA